MLYILHFNRIGFLIGVHMIENMMDNNVALLMMCLTLFHLGDVLLTLFHLGAQSNGPFIKEKSMSLSLEGMRFILNGLDHLYVCPTMKISPCVIRFQCNS